MCGSTQHLIESQNIDQFFLATEFDTRYAMLFATTWEPDKRFRQTGLPGASASMTTTFRQPFNPTFYEQLVANNQQVELRIYPTRPRRNRPRRRFLILCPSSECVHELRNQWPHAFFCRQHICATNAAVMRLHGPEISAPSPSGDGSRYTTGE